MAALLNNKDLSLQTSAYRDKTTTSSITGVSSTTGGSITGFITEKNGGPTSPSYITLTATPNIVFTNAAVYTWSYSLNNNPTVYTTIGTNSNTYQLTSAFVLSILGTGTAIRIRCEITENLLDKSTSYYEISYGVESANNDAIVVEITRSTATITCSALGVPVAPVAPSIVYPNTDTQINVSRAAIFIKYNNCVVSGSSGTTINCNTTTPLAVNSVIKFATAFGSVVVGTTYYVKQIINATTFSISTIKGGTVVFNVGTSTTSSVTYIASTWTVTITADATRTISGPTINATNYQIAGLTNITADTSSVIFGIFVYDASAVVTPEISKKISYSKLKDGNIGEPSTQYFIVLDAPLIYKTAAEYATLALHTNVTAKGKRSVGSVISDYGYLTYKTVLLDDTNSADSVAILSSTGLTITPGTTNNIKGYKISLWNNNESNKTLLDSQSVPIILEGDASSSVLITNDNASITVSVSGSPTTNAYNNTGTYVRVFLGTEELQFIASGTLQNSQWSVTTTPTGITPGAITVSGKQALVANAGNITQDFAKIIFTITGKTASGAAISLTKEQTLNKVYPGVDAVVNSIKLSSPVITKDKPNIIETGLHTSITISGLEKVGTSLAVSKHFVTFTPSSLTNKFTSSVNGTTITLTALTGVSNTSLPLTAGIHPGMKLLIVSSGSGSIPANTAITSITGPNTITVNNSITATNLQFSVIEAATAVLSISTSISNYDSQTSYIVKLYNQATVAGATLLDTQIIPVIFTGSSTILLALSNDRTTVSTDSSGGNGTYTATGTDLTLYEGAVPLTPISSGTVGNGQWKITSAVGASIGPGSASITDNTVSYSNASNMTADNAIITYTVEGKSIAGVAFSLVKQVQSFSKIKAAVPGANGIGLKTAKISCWKADTVLQVVSNSNHVPPTAISYNWTNGSYTGGYPSGWYATSPALTNGQTAYNLVLEIIGEIAAGALVPPNTVINWNTGVISQLGFRQDGTQGLTGTSAKIAYITTTSASPPGTPAATDGSSSLPAAVDTFTWVATAPTAALVAGQFTYQSNGFLSSGGIITWQAPYLSNLKVGNLQALSANTGALVVTTSITAGGTLPDATGQFSVNQNGQVVISGIVSSGNYLKLDNNSLSIFAGNALRVKIGNLD
jgi:hypothetical protein